MIQRWVLYALFRVAEEGAREEGIRALKGCDPLIKPWAKKRVIVALRRAEGESGSDDVPHLARLASFSVAKKTYEAGFNDISGLATEYEKEFGRPRKPATGPLVLLTLLLTSLLAIVASTLLYFQMRAFEPSQTEVGELMEQAFTRIAIGAANGNAQQSRAALAAFVQEPSFSSKKEITALVDKALSVRGNLDQLDHYRNAALALNKSLEKHKVPYYVDADIYPLAGVPSPILLSFFVQERGSFTTSSKEIQVLRLWRLDHLNVVQTKLGYTRPASPYAIVLLDHIEHDLVTQILPAVPDGELMSLTDEDTGLSQEEWVAELQEKGADVIRKHFASMPAAVTEKARNLGALLAKRRSLLAKWERNLGAHHTLRMPKRLIPEADYSTELHLRVSASDRVDWENLHSELLTEQHIADFEEIREAYVRSVERHEVQHRLDYATERFTIPQMLAFRMGGIDQMGHELHSHPMSASMELSAYLSQIAEDPSPRLSLMTMGRIFLNKYSMRTAHGYAGVVVLEATAKHLGLGRSAILGRIATRQKLAQLLISVCEKPMPEVRAAARKAYRELFEEDLPQVTRGSFQKQPRWRH